jgi:hypothetical protein
MNSTGSHAIAEKIDETGDFTILCCSLRRKSKDWLALNQDNVSVLDDMSIRGLLFQ